MCSGFPFPTPQFQTSHASTQSPSVPGPRLSSASFLCHFSIPFSKLDIYIPFPDPNWTANLGAPKCSWPHVFSCTGSLLILLAVPARSTFYFLPILWNLEGPTQMSHIQQRLPSSTPLPFFAPNHLTMTFIYVLLSSPCLQKEACISSFYSFSLQTSCPRQKKLHFNV